MLEAVARSRRGLCRRRYGHAAQTDSSQELLSLGRGDQARNIAIVEKGKLAVRTADGIVGVVLPKMVVGEGAINAGWVTDDEGKRKRKRKRASARSIGGRPRGRHRRRRICSVAHQGSLRQRRTGHRPADSHHPNGSGVAQLAHRHQLGRRPPLDGHPREKDSSTGWSRPFRS